jgi:hypothetical protein
MKPNIPSTYDEAIAALVELDVARWGELERIASEKLHRQNFRGSYGLALNSLAHRSEYDYGDSAPELAKAAEKALTSDDRAELRKGG